MIQTFQSAELEKLFKKGYIESFTSLGTVDFQSYIRRMLLHLHNAETLHTLFVPKVLNNLTGPIDNNFMVEIERSGKAISFAWKGKGDNGDVVNVDWVLL